jgi:hypothetical protein
VIPRYEGRAVAPGRQGNQRVILKLTSLRDLPILRVADRNPLNTRAHGRV